MSRVGKDAVKMPESVSATVAPYGPDELWPIKEPSAYRLYRMRKSRPERESFQAFGTPHRVTIAGPLGELRVPVHSFCSVEQQGSSLQVTAQCGGKTKLGRTMWGTVRGYLANAVHGVSQGYRKDLELHGVGFRARVEPDSDPEAAGRPLLILRLGFSHEVEFPVPDGVEITVPAPTTVVVFGADKRQVGNVAASIKRLRKPDAYKGKGIRYAGEVIKLKPGKRR